MQRTYRITLIIMCLLFVPIAVYAVETDMTKALPASAAIGDWSMDGQITLFDKETLFDHINGESELYFPYGFEELAFARYVHSQNPQAAIDVDIYKMGSLLEAFGIFANYRRKDDAHVSVGAEGTASSSRFLFYQDRYFVSLQSSGTADPGADIFISFARTISEKLPQNTAKPQELEALNIPAIEPKSLRYIAQSLLGYDFFRKGIIADAVVNDEKLQVFLVRENTTDAAKHAFDQYSQYLKKTDRNVLIARTQHGVSLKAFDPLYGNVVVEQAGQSIFGLVRLKDFSLAEQLMDKLYKKITGE